ncbi:MAG: ribbon-helix-helix domain-containing protein [Candidatus Omnitrophota bacterium]
MVTVQMTLEEGLVKRVDDLVQKMHTSRSAFARDALKEAIKKYQNLELEKKHKLGYERHPVKPNEFDVFEKDQAWGDE